jgi:hypothetical protein
VRRAPARFCGAKLVVRIDEYRHNCEQRLEFSRQAPAFLSQNRDVVPQNSVHTLNRECVAFVAHIPHVFAPIRCVAVPKISVSAVLFRVPALRSIFRIAVSSSLPGYDAPARSSWQSEKYPRKSVSLFKWFDYTFSGLTVAFLADTRNALGQVRMISGNAGEIRAASRNYGVRFHLAVRFPVIAVLCFLLLCLLWCSCVYFTFLRCFCPLMRSDCFGSVCVFGGADVWVRPPQSQSNSPNSSFAPDSACAPPQGRLCTA